MGRENSICCPTGYWQVASPLCDQLLGGPSDRAAFTSFEPHAGQAISVLSRPRTRISTSTTRRPPAREDSHRLARGGPRLLHRRAYVRVAVRPAPVPSVSASAPVLRRSTHHDPGHHVRPQSRSVARRLARVPGRCRLHVRSEWHDDLRNSVLTARARQPSPSWRSIQLGLRSHLPGHQLRIGPVHLRFTLGSHRGNNLVAPSLSATQEQ